MKHRYRKKLALTSRFLRTEVSDSSMVGLNCFLSVPVPVFCIYCRKFSVQRIGTPFVAERDNGERREKREERREKREERREKREGRFNRF